MSIISLTNLKGGVTKSTTAVHLAYWLSEIKNKKVVFVDADANATSSKWLSRLELELPVHRILDPDDLAERIPVFKEQADYVIVDNAGSATEATRCTFLNADAVAIPISPSPVDMETTLSTIKIIRQFQKSQGRPKAGIFIAKARKNTKLLGETQKAISSLEGITPLKTVIYHRELIADCYLRNATIWNLKQAQEEQDNYRKLFLEILKLTK